MNDNGNNGKMVVVDGQVVDNATPNDIDNALDELWETFNALVADIAPMVHRLNDVTNDINTLISHRREHVVDDDAWSRTPLDIRHQL